MANYATLKAAINAVIRANGNKEITGTVLNETLTAMVNSLGANYQFAGVATPSTNPGTPDQNVFYLAGQAGTYTNFNSIVLPNGVSVLKWNGSWSSETVVAGDGVFDISAYKATGGTLATFADLSAALDGGNNIPSALRKGGMSVKFVQSSDNKYIQFRLMSDSFNTTVANWQGVDDEPTSGSDNLVKSGGVYNKFSKIIGNINIGQYIDGNGNTVNDTNWAYIFCKVNGGETVLYTSGNEVMPDVKYLVEYSESGSILNTWRAGGYSPRNFELTNSTKYIKASFLINSPYAWVLKVNNEDCIDRGSLEKIAKKVELNTDELESFNKELNHIVGILSNDKAITSSGEEISASGYLATSKIYVQTGNVIKYNSGFSASGLGVNYSLVAFDEYGNTVDYYAATDYERTITVPANTSYIKATFKTDTSYYILVNGINLLAQGSLIPAIFEDIKDNGNDIIGIDGNIVPGKALNEVSGQIVEDADYFVTRKIPVKPNDVVKYNAKFSGSSYYYGIAAFSNTNACLSGWIATESEREITLPANAFYIIATFKKQTTGHYLRINNEDVITYGKIGKIDARITAVEDEIIDKERIVNINNYLLSNASNGNVWVPLGITLVGGEKYRIELTVKKPSNSAYYYLENLYACNAGAYASSRVEDITSLFGVTRLEPDVTYVADYIPHTDDITYLNYSFNSSDYSLDYSTDLHVTLLSDKFLKKEQLERLAEMPINIFGDVLPPLFKEKLDAAAEDLLIAVQGDSITGLIEDCVEQEVPQHCPPGQQYKSWLWRLQQNISKVKPVCDRIDSQRNNVDVFSKMGTWQNVVDIAKVAIYGDDGSVYGQQRSISAETFQSTDSNAAVSFEFDADTYDKCNIVYSKEPDAVLTKIIIQEGNGKMLVSDDRSTWVEANGYSCNQRTSIAVYNSDVDAALGNANRESQRRLWMKKVSTTTGTIHISYQRDNSVSYENSCMYCWGIEKWKGVAVFIDNLGRGGRYTRYLKANISDIFDRNPDLAIFEMPLANEIGHSTNPLSITTLKGNDYYGEYFFGENGDSFKHRSVNYTTLPLIVLLPHGRSGYFDNNNSAIVWEGTGGAPEGQPAAYTGYKQMYGWLRTRLSTFKNVKFVNLYDQLINEALKLNNKINAGFYRTYGGNEQITYDTIHLNDYGAKLYNKYLAGIFQL